MSKGLEALEKIDHTICMNNLANNIKWDIDKYDHCACVSVEDFVECYEIIEKELKALEILRECNLTIDEFNKKFDFISGKVPKDKIDLLKEVLK